MPKPKPQLVRDMKWLATFPAGMTFLADDAFRPNRVAELVKAGSLIPCDGRPGVYVIGLPFTVEAAA